MSSDTWNLDAEQQRLRSAVDAVLDTMTIADIRTLVADIEAEIARGAVCILPVLRPAPTIDGSPRGRVGSDRRQSR